MSSELCVPRTYYALALDPIHVGTGGYRLGQVDLTILREPGTNVPKIPGSSLAGAARAYTARRYKRYRRYDANDQTYVSCAGKGGEDGSGHCGEMDCPVCVSYGFTIGPQSRSFHGMAQFYDAQVLFFPVYSALGPVWVTSAGALAAAGYDLPDAQRADGERVRAAPGLIPSDAGRRAINLGWLYLDAEDEDLDCEAIPARRVGAHRGAPGPAPRRALERGRRRQPGGAHLGGHRPGDRRSRGPGAVHL